MATRPPTGSAQDSRAVMHAHLERQGARSHLDTAPHAHARDTLEMHDGGCLASILPACIVNALASAYACLNSLIQWITTFCRTPEAQRDPLNGARAELAALPSTFPRLGKIQAEVNRW